MPTTTAKPGRAERNPQSTRELPRPLCFAFTIIDHFLCKISPPKGSEGYIHGQYVLEYIYWIFGVITNDWEEIKHTSNFFSCPFFLVVISVSNFLPLIETQRLKVCLLG